MTTGWPLYSPETSETQAAGWEVGRGASLTLSGPLSQPQAGGEGGWGRSHSPGAEGQILRRASRRGQVWGVEGKPWWRLEGALLPQMGVRPWRGLLPSDWSSCGKAPVCPCR